MLKNILKSFVVAAIPFASSFADASDVNKVPARGKDYRKGEVIVKVSSDAAPNGNQGLRSATALDATLKELGATSVEELMPLTRKNARGLRSSDDGVVYRVKIDEKSSVEDAVSKLKELDDVEFAEPNYIVYALSSSDPTSGVEYDDPLFSQQWGIPAINLSQLWQKPVITTKRPVIAILDTGVDTEHPDLKDNVWVNEAENDGESGYDDDGNGYADDIHGWDFVNNSSKIKDYNGHGTHCAGIAAAVGGNGIGIVGANPDALIMPITVMQSDGTGDVATIIKGIDYAAANGADVISMSFGGYAYSMAEEQALAKAYAKCVLVAAAGNDGHSINYGVHCSLLDYPMFPAAFTFVLGVEASDKGGVKAGFSNYDDDGPIFSVFGEEKLYNYELRAPGVGIMSTYPNGKYKQLSGTSMACPLVAGAVSRLLQTKEYDSKEILFGDLIQTRKSDIDILAAYNISDEDRTPSLDLVSYNVDDTEGGDGDGRFDAGETIKIYPIIRNAWGQANNIKVWMEFDELDNDSYNIESDTVSFGKNLSSYAKATSLNPIVIKINKDVADGRHIKMNIKATCDNVSNDMHKEFVEVVENGVEIGGMITEDLTLYPNVNYIVTKTLVVPEGVKLTIKPGTKLGFKNETGISFGANSIIDIHGTSDSMIVFKNSDNNYNSRVEFKSINSLIDTLSYCIIEGLSFSSFDYLYYNNTVFRLNTTSTLINTGSGACHLNKCNIYSNSCWALFWGAYYVFPVVKNSNIVENSAYPYGYLNVCDYIVDGLNNILGNFYDNELSNLRSIEHFGNEKLGAVIPVNCYLGSSKESIVRKGVYDIENNYDTYKYNLSNMLTQPNPEAHGIVWKVVVNGYDAQDEFEMLPPLGVGKQKFEVWYSKKVNEKVNPTISMGVRAPYTQISIGEEGSWRTETVKYVVNGDTSDLDVSVYTAYVTLSGRSATDGLNRIFVSGGEDLEHFEIPDEKTRFNVEVSASGSMSAGFEAEAGLGKVTLSWEAQDENVDDILGYNLYRYQVKEGNGEVSSNAVADTMKINEMLLDDTEFVDYDVVPGETYYYYYKIMRTDLMENSPSKTVASTPLTASKGDANGSMTVDIADVVTEIAYLTNQDPQPFILDAADVNNDSIINILDVVGTINIIVKPSGVGSNSLNDEPAYYSVEKGVLYLTTSTAIGGVQVSIESKSGDIKFLDALNGFETVLEKQVGDRYLVLVYSMSGKYLAPGKYALLNIGEASVDDIVLSNTKGQNVSVVSTDETGVENVSAEIANIPYPNPFADQVTIPYYVKESGKHKVRIEIYDALGRIKELKTFVKGAGLQGYIWRPNEDGVYVAKLYIDGVLNQTYKLIKIKN